MLGMGKHSRLICNSISDEEKGFIKLIQYVSVIKLVLFVDDAPAR